MSDEVIVQPGAVARYRSEREELAAWLVSVGASARENGLFVGLDPGSSWEYDVRLWLRDDDVFVEISGHGHGYHTVLLPLVQRMVERYAARVVDEDGAAVRLRGT